ncbi:LacI family DNA-binding transcriptional regulator [Alloscardovia omnicolens]|uniref:LacI family DNA-binding transcriptional regulator n=1 Tax=Alloscardovia omnicolens TaxID=419015 RepID=UPI003A6711F3
MTTMKEISQIAGVSISTVSLVLNNRDSGRIKPRIAAKIRKIAKERGYTPNLMARGLRTSQTHILGFLSEEVATTPYAGLMILGAQDAASQYGYVIMTVSTDGISNEEAEISALQRYGVDGFFIAKMSNRHATVPESLKNYHTILVNASDAALYADTPTDNHAPSGRTGIAPDEVSIGYDATKRLIDAGCHKIAYIGCEEPMLAEGLRLEGYKKALAEAGREFNPALAIQVHRNDEALQKVRTLMNDEHPDGFFCFNDARAWYVYDTAARMGLTIGEDIHVVGVDNHRVLAETLSPQLSTIELPHYEMGYWAACKLISLIEHKNPDSFTLPETTAALPPLSCDGNVSIHCSLIEKNSVKKAQQ